MVEPLFRRLTLIGVGLIGSSVARAAMNRGDIASELVACARTGKTRERVRELGIAHRVEADPARAVELHGRWGTGAFDGAGACGARDERRENRKPRRRAKHHHA